MILRWIGLNKIYFSYFHLFLFTLKKMATKILKIYHIPFLLDGAALDGCEIGYNTNEMVWEKVLCVARRLWSNSVIRSAWGSF